MATTATSPVQHEQQQQPDYPYQPQAQPQGSLYVGDLDPNVTEAMLFEVFNSIGPVASIRVCRDTITRRSLGYGYVNYMSVSDAEKALDSLNYALIKGNPVRIMWSNRDPSIRKSGTGNIFIKNLDPSIDNKALHDTFSAFGNILSCKVAMDGDVSKGYGFVHYETMEQAESAINSVNGMLLNDRQVYVGLHVSKKERDSKIEEMRSKFTNIYVKNIDASVDQAKFSEIFEAFGPVTSCVLALDESGASKEFGFVNYESHEAAQRAVDEMNDKELAGKVLYVGRAQKKNEREEDLRKQYEKIREEKLSKYQGVNLYVKNLDDGVDEETLRQEFSQFGVITSCKIMLDERTNASKGFGFVCFSNPDEATKAVTEMNGKILKTKPLYVALAQRKDARRAQLAAQIQQRQFRMQPGMIPGVPNGYPGQPMFYPPQQRGFFPGQPQMIRPQQFPQPGVPMQGRPQFPMQPPQGFAQVPIQQGRPRPQQQKPPAGRGAAPQQAPAQANRGRNFKYTANAQNRPQVPAPAQGVDLASLATLDPDAQKRMLGEIFFPLIAQITPVYAGKVTGMLLEMDNAELLHLLEDKEAFNERVAEAVDVLEKHMQQQGANE